MADLPASPYLYGEDGWNKITTIIYTPGPVISHGFPFYYTRTHLWRWNIIFDPGTYMNLLVVNISLDNPVVSYVQSVQKETQSFE